MKRWLWCLLAAGLWAADYPFTAPASGELVAHLQLSAPGTDWEKTGHETVTVDLLVDGAAKQQVMLVAGATSHQYTVFLNGLKPGPHRLSLQRNDQFSAAGAQPETAKVDFAPVTGETALALRHAPILLARANTLGKYSDVPLLLYCERLTENGQPVLQYTVIFSNEDGGTSTRALMARWGRTTDIEYIYRVFLDAQGGAVRGRIQSKDHQEIDYTGPRENDHPLLMPITNNNMAGPGTESPLRFQLAPQIVDLTNKSREQVMDSAPWTYLLMAKELIREQKLRPYGTVEGEKISDLRNYLFLDIDVVNNSRSAVAAYIKLKSDPRWFPSHLGRADYGIERNGPFRTTVELPPGTRADQIAEVGFTCVVVPERTGYPARSGPCQIKAADHLFLLGPDYQPRPLSWKLLKPIELTVGQVQSFPL